MPATDSTLLQAATDFSGSLLFAVTALVTLFGVLVVALSFRRVPARVPTRARPPR
jgi:hypothetical protein